MISLRCAMRSDQAYGQLASVYPQVVGLAAVLYSLMLVSIDDDVRRGIELSYA